METRVFSATGIYPLTNVDTASAGSLVIQTRLASGTGVTWAVRKRATGTAPGTGGASVVPVADAAAPRTWLTNALTGAPIDNATAITATTAPQIHSVICDGCDVLLEVLSVTGAGVLRVDMNAALGGT